VHFKKCVGATMNTIETNIFPILNLKDLSAAYRVYRIRGLRTDHSEYHQNRQAITRQASFLLKTPALVLDSKDAPVLVVRSDSAEPPSPMQIVRGAVYFDDANEQRDVDFFSSDPEVRQIAIRFLGFMLQTPLSVNGLLWQPRAGGPFFEKRGESDNRGVTRYTGFTARVMPTPDGALGLCVDVASKFASSQPLSPDLTRHQFRPLKGRSVIYRYGHRWYEVRLNEISDLSASEYLIPGDGRTLLQFIIDTVQKPAPLEIAQLRPESSVLLYQTNSGELRGAPAALCYPVLDSFEAPTFAGKRKLFRPFERRALTNELVSKYLRNLRFGGVCLDVASVPVRTDQKIFSVPDLLFGNSRVLSTTGSPKAQHVSLDSLGRVRAALLRDPKAGFYSRAALGKQVLLMPQSVSDTCGTKFLADLQAAVNELYPTATGYSPQVVIYDDRVGKTFVEQGKSILGAAVTAGLRGAYALVMLHDTRHSRSRQHDQLASLITKKFAELDVCASVIHTDVVLSSYVLERTSSETRYVVKRERQGKLSGYIRNVALNKVLLTNECWPFVLGSPLHAEVTIGIDVKQNTVGFTLVAGHGRLVRTSLSTSHQKEKLLSQQLRKLLVELITAEAQATFSCFKSLVIHRDGILFDSERRGIESAIEDLRGTGSLRSDCQYAVLEIPKSGPVPLRLYDVTDGNGRKWVENPQVGTYYMMDEQNAFLCATGRAFSHEGTVHPIHIRYATGTLPFIQCIEDIYSLTCLTWTKPDDCMRNPITIKLTDRRLGEDASQYDEDAFEYEMVDAE
jgi:hypothetical protein